LSACINFICAIMLFIFIIKVLFSYFFCFGNFLSGVF